MADVLAEIGGVKLTIRMAGIAAALLTLILFMLLRMAMNRSEAPGTRKGLSLMDGIGFGLLPAAAVWKIFESMYTGAGREVTEPLPLIPWLTEKGRFIPGNIETAAALLCFIGICLWLMIRKNRPEGAGDLLMISLCLWAGIRIVTEDFRDASDNVFRYLYCAVILICLGVWTARYLKQARAKQRVAGNWVVAVLCTAMIVLTSSGTLSVGSEIGDLAVIAGCAGLMVLTALMCGGDSRKWGAFRSPPTPPSGAAP